MKVVNSSVAFYSVAAAQVIAGRNAMVTPVNTGNTFRRLIDNAGNLTLILERKAFDALIVSEHLLAGLVT